MAILSRFFCFHSGYSLSIWLVTDVNDRFSNAVGAFIYPMYGHGELPQAFCRCAAVKGALYVSLVCYICRK